MVEEPDRARTKAAGVTNPWRCGPDQGRARIANTIGYTITVYGTAKNPAAPAPNSNAGTATKVYAVYRSPPTRNQVTQEPKLRPPRPHSSRCAMVDGRRQRAATNPNPLTITKRTVAMTISVICALTTAHPRFFVIWYTSVVVP